MCVICGGLVTTANQVHRHFAESHEWVVTGCYGEFQRDGLHLCYASINAYSLFAFPRRVHREIGKEKETSKCPFNYSSWNKKEQFQWWLNI